MVTTMSSVCDAEVRQDRRVGAERGGVDVFLQPVVGPHAVAEVLRQGRVVDRRRRHTERRPHEWNALGVLVVEQVHAGDAEQTRHDDQRPRPVRHGDVGLRADHERQQLRGTPEGSSDLQALVRPVVTPDGGVREAEVVGQGTDLEGVPGRDHHRVPRSLQLTDDGKEERDVRSVVQVNPDSPGRDRGRLRPRSPSIGSSGRLTSV